MKFEQLAEQLTAQLTEKFVEVAMTAEESGIITKEESSIITKEICEEYASEYVWKYYTKQDTPDICNGKFTDLALYKLGEHFKEDIEEYIWENL